MLWRDEQLDAPEVSYWIGREFWGRGFATRALAEFLGIVRRRPLYGARRSRTSARSGFSRSAASSSCANRGFANARGEELDELVFLLGDGPAR
jgi:Acetyltransferase (GNAT) domain